jgi:hypothetical protein
MKDLIFHIRDRPVIRKIFREIKRLKNQGLYKFHTIQQVLESTEKHLINADWQCSKYSNLSIDADGEVRLCLRRNPFKGYNILDFDKQYIQASFTEDWYNYSKDCAGCLYDCQMQSEYLLKKGKEEGKEVFIHSEKGGLSMIIYRVKEFTIDHINDLEWFFLDESKANQFIKEKIVDSHWESYDINIIRIVRDNFDRDFLYISYEEIEVM